MAALENVSVENLRQIILAEVDDADATKRLMAAITYKEMEDLTQTEAAELCGFSSSWASKWFNRLERLAVPSTTTGMLLPGNRHSRDSHGGNRAVHGAEDVMVIRK